MLLFSHKSERLKADQVINNHLRRLLEGNATSSPADGAFGIGISSAAGEPGPAPEITSGSGGAAAALKCEEENKKTESSNGGTMSDKDNLSGLVSTLANDLAECFMGAFEDLQRRLIAESQRLNQTNRQHFEELQTSVEGVVGLREPVDQLMAAVGALQESDERRNAEIGTLREEHHEFRQFVVNQGEEIEALKVAFADATRKAAGVSETLDRQGRVIRQLHELENHRAAALQHAFESLSRLNHTMLPEQQPMALAG